jgi:nucleoid-associated protein YgaU
VRHNGIILLVLVVLCGCAGTTQTSRVVDISKGEFYSNEEIKGLSPDARDRYCASLNAEIERLRAETETLLASADSVAHVSDSLKMVNSDLTTQIRDLDGEVRQLRLERRAATIYVVKAGDTLQKIASVVYGQSSRWNDIYLANKDRIGAPNAPLQVGTQLNIPAK